MNKDSGINKLTEEQIQEYLNIQHKLIQQERTFLESLRKERKIGDEALRKIEYELDLEESRLKLELNGSM